MASEDVRYRQSTQYRLWSFSPAQLASMREKTNALARSTISDHISTSTSNSNSNSNSNANTPDPDAPPQSQPQQLPDFLTPAEEALLLTFYTSELIRAGDHVGMTAEIKATAAVFLRRFYITNSVMTYPPTEMLLVALFFGSKAEGDFRSVRHFAADFNKENPEEILAGEFLLCQGIRFAFDVKHPYRALEGAIMELSRYGDIEEKRIHQAHARAREILKFSPLITDAHFHYTPSQIMLAALSLADRGLAERLIQATFHYVPPASDSGADTPVQSANGSDGKGMRKGSNIKAGEDKAQIIGPHIRDKVLGTIEACREMLARELPERREHWSNGDIYKSTIQPLVRKLRKCRDPDRTNLVALQRARREQTNRKVIDSEEEDDSGRRSGNGTVEDDGAVFGEPVGQRDPKRRKVSRTQENVFGGAL